MDCALVRNHLDAYVDGELEPSPSATLETHLHACTLCRDELLMSRALKRAVHGLPRPAVAESMRADVIRALDQAERGAGSSRRNMAFTGALAVAAAALFVVIAGIRPPPAPVADSATAPSLPSQMVAWHNAQLPSDIRTEPNDGPLAEPNLDQASGWLSDKVGFRVQPPEFGRPDVRLVGARVATVGSQPAASLSYRVGNSRMTVTVFQPADDAQHLLHDDDALARAGAHRKRVGSHMVTYQNQRGYAVSMLEHGGLAYSFVSDLDEQSLLQLIGSARLP
jgi:anti-sigma factor RsiW